MNRDQKTLKYKNQKTLISSVGSTVCSTKNINFKIELFSIIVRGYLFPVYLLSCFWPVY
jgi:hypothetical protein